MACYNCESLKKMFRLPSNSEVFHQTNVYLLHFVPVVLPYNSEVFHDVRLQVCLQVVTLHENHYCKKSLLKLRPVKYSLTDLTIYGLATFDQVPT